MPKFLTWDNNTFKQLEESKYCLLENGEIKQTHFFDDELRRFESEGDERFVIMFYDEFVEYQGFKGFGYTSQKIVALGQTEEELKIIKVN